MSWKKSTNGGSSSISKGSENGSLVVDGEQMVVYDDNVLDNAKADVVHTHSVSQINDFDTTNKTNGYVMQYDSVSNKYVLRPLPEGIGSGATNLDGLSDVDVTTEAPFDGNVLKFEGGIWKAGRNESSTANAEIPLVIDPGFAGSRNNEGMTSAMHAHVVQFTTAWNGYKYWMAYTPLATEEWEDPCLAVSNDLIKWVTPPGVVNPIDTQLNNLPNFYSDTHLVYNSNLNRLECWYRYAGYNPPEIIYRKVSTNGRTWSEKEEIARADVTGALGLVCPIAIYDAGKYRIWAGYNRSTIRYYESVDGANWQYIADVSGAYDWHFDFHKTDKGIEYVGGSSTGVSHAISTDGINFTNRKVIIPVGKKGHFDEKGCYKPSLLKVGKRYHVFYSGLSDYYPQMTGLSIATIDNDINSLQGLTAGAENAMAKWQYRKFSDLELTNQLQAKYIKLVNGSTNLTLDADTTGNIGYSINGAPRKHMQPIYSGSTANRPSGYKEAGLMYIDTTLGKPIWYIGGWKDAMGNLV